MQTTQTDLEISENMIYSTDCVCVMAQPAQTAQPAHLKDVKMITIAQEAHDQFNFKKERHPPEESMRLYCMHRRWLTQRQIIEIRQHGPYYLFEMDIIVRENEKEIVTVLVEPHEKEMMHDYIQGLEYLSFKRDRNRRRQSLPIWNVPDTQNWIPEPFDNPNALMHNPYNLTFHNNIVATY